LEVTAANLQAGVPTLFHCAAGRDRTGVMAALLLDLVGVTFGEIARDYVQSNRNARRVTQKLAENPLYANHEAHMREVILLHEQTILGFLRLLQAEAGGSRQFCLDSGLSEETIAVLDTFVGDPDDAGSST
jgi:hypothetical protein